MARVTVEDCILNVPNRFDLVLLAAQRAKQISSGNPLTVDRDNDKDAVVSLREIADKTISLDQLKEETTNSFSKRRSVEEKRPEEAKEEGEIQEVFADAAQGIEEPVVEGEAPGGLSFEGENVQAED